MRQAAFSRQAVGGTQVARCIPMPLHSKKAQQHWSRRYQQEALSQATDENGA